MVRHVTSPTFIGRGEQLDALLGHARAGQPAVALVSGEAGVGKTRLISELTARATAEGSVCLVGGCVEFGGQVLPLAPAVTIVRGLTDRLDAEALDQVLGPSRGDLGRLVPALADEPPEGGPPPPARLFELLLGVLHRLAEHAQVVVVLEDLHWADSTSRDLFAFLARALRKRVLLVGTFRSDELHRRHPLRPVVAELRRAARPEDITLEPHTRTEIAELFAGVIGAPPDEHVADEVHRRAGGNAFYAEELIAGGDLADVVPASLREVILARAASQDESAFRLLCIAAAAGGVDDIAVVASVADLAAEAAEGQLAALAADGFLVQGHRGWSFRHELAREVFEGELLPGERTRVHVKLAEQLQERQPDRVGRISWHLWRAGDQPHALEWSIRAAQAAEAVGAMAEAQESYERALDVWDQVPDAAKRTGMTHPDVLLAAANAAHEARRIDDAVELARTAIDELASSPVAAGGAWLRLAQILWTGAQPGVQEAIERALELIPAEPPSGDRAYALARQGGLLFLQGRTADAVAVSEEALRHAGSLGDRAVALPAHLYALNTLAGTAAYRGHAPGAEMMRDALDQAQAAGSPFDIARGYVNLVQVLRQFGHYDEAIATAVDGEQAASDLGMALTGGILIAINELDALRWSGRWDDVVTRVSELRESAGEEAFKSWYGGLVSSYGYVLLRRGQVADARPMISKLAEDVSHGQYQGAVGILIVAQVELAVHDRAWDQPRGLVEQALPTLLESYPVESAEVVAAGIMAEVECSALRPGQDDTDVLTLADDWLGQVSSVGKSFAGTAFADQLDTWLAQARAERSRLANEPAAEAWEQIATAWAHQQRSYEAAYAWLRAGEALLVEVGLTRSDQRDRSAAWLDRAREAAERLGAVRIIDGVAAVARQARLPTADTSPTEPGVGSDVDVSEERPFGLTDRELQVLLLVAAGHSNGEIGAALFVSRKTASVHVSNILRKLDAANRVEAAAIAHRAGLIEPDADDE